jgi:hypothetical protein
MYGQVGDVVSLEDHTTACGLDISAQQVEEGRLAGSIRADNRVECIGAYLEADIVYRNEGAKFFTQLIGFQNDLVIHALLQKGTPDPKLDFIHLHINKKQGKLWHLSAKKEAATYLAQRIYHNPDEFCPAV